MLNELRQRYLDSIVVHHNHYFPNNAPIGHTHQICNIKCFQKGLPPSVIYVHNMTNYDSSFMLRMLPRDILARKGKNQENEWSVISPKGNKNKIKLLITPFGRFVDSMNFFNSSLENMAKEMTNDDLANLFKLHYSYFASHPKFKGAMQRRAKEDNNEFTFSKFKEMFRGKLLFPYQSMNDLDWLMIESDNIPPIEEFRNNVFGKEGPTQEAYDAMNNIYHYFECKTMSDLLHVYTLEDGMLLACIMSNTFVRMYDALGLDPTNFTSTAKYSYVSAKRLTNMSMQTIPNARVFDCIVKMKRAGFSMTKKQITQSSPFKSHIETCEYNDQCQKCGPFAKTLNEDEVKLFREESRRVVKESKEKTLEFLRLIIAEQLQDEKSQNTPEQNAEVEETQRLYETLKDCAFEGGEDLKEDEEFLMLLQSCIIYFDKNNQYGYALKQTLPVGNYMWMRYDKETGGSVKPQTLVDILNQQRRKLEANPKATIVDFYTCVNINLHTDTCTKSEMKRGEEFNLLVRNKVPEVYNFTEKMLTTKRCEYVRQKNVYKKIPTYSKLISGVEPLKNYWIHSSILREALLDGWTIDKVCNTLVFSAQRVCEEYIQFNQDM